MAGCDTLRDDSWMHRAALFLAFVVATAAAQAAPIPVRFVEGLTRGYMLLRDLDNRILAHGDLLQVVKGEEIEKQMVFRFKDGSLYDERVTYTERGAFRLKTYHLTQRGPAFDEDVEISLTASTGAYTVKKKDHDDGKEKTDDGKLDVPDDLYNGLLMTIVKDLPKGGATVFPDVRLEVAPKRGNAVFFNYERPHPSTRTLHGGAPVLAGTKWIATKWLRERRFE